MTPRPDQPRTAAGQAFYYGNAVKGFEHKLLRDILAIEAEAAAVPHSLIDLAANVIADGAAGSGALDVDALWLALESCSDILISGPRDHVLPHLRDEYARLSQPPAEPTDP